MADEDKNDSWWSRRSRFSKVVLVVVASLPILLFASSCSVDLNSASSTTTTTSSSHNVQLPEEHKYQLEVKAMAQEMQRYEDREYAILGSIDEIIAPEFSSENKEEVRAIASGTDELWEEWKDRETPSKYYAVLHRNILSYLRHSAEGMTSLRKGFLEEDVEEVQNAIVELSFAAKAKMRVISEGNKIAAEQGL